jgi:hypothetical protein
VKWDDVCKPKKDGGLGIRDLRIVNISLLIKWRWKLLSCQSEIWKEVIVAKYIWWGGYWESAAWY